MIYRVHTAALRFLDDRNDWLQVRLHGKKKIHSILLLSVIIMGIPDDDWRETVYTVEYEEMPRIIVKAIFAPNYCHFCLANNFGISQPIPARVISID